MQKLIILLVFTLPLGAIAQVAPAISVRNVNGHSIIRWSDTGNSVTSINVQRSADSSRNFITIAGIPNKTDTVFFDEKVITTKVFYRLFISFKGGGYLFTPSYPFIPDPVEIVLPKKLVPGSRIMTKRKDTALIPATKPVIDIPEPTATVKNLKEVRVQTKLKYVEQDIDKLTYHVDADPESRSMNALDMLRKIPLVIVDGEDNIEVNGSTNFLVLVNGRRSSLFARSPKDVFKSMPASSIKNIEIITSPSSRYEAEGVGGIINVITNKKMVNGYNGSANAIVSSPKGFSTSGNITAKTRKSGFSGYFGNNNSLSRSSSNFLRENFNQKNILQQSGESGNKNASLYFGSEISYEIDSSNLITANYGFNNSKGENTFSQQVKLLGNNAATLEEYRYLNEGETKWKGNDLGLDYQHNFNKNNEQLLTISYQLNNSNNTNPFYYTRQITNSSQTSYSDNNDRYAEHTAQADYFYSIKEKTIELGIKSIYRLNKSDYSYQTQLPGSTGYITDSSQSDKFDYRQTIYAGYASLSLKKKSVGVKVGVRLEDTEVNARFRTTRSHARESYLNLIPNITVSQKMNGPAIVKLSYTQRIERPGLFYLNPYIDVSDPKNISFGNPKLRPAINNVLHLSYNTFISGYSVNAGIFHNFTNNSIQRFTTLGTDSIARTTFGNIGKNQVTGVTVNGITTLFKNLSVNVNSTVNYIKFSGIINGRRQNNSGVVLNVFGYGSYRFEKGWRASSSIGYSSANILLQGKSSGYGWNTISVQKDLLQDTHASISLSVTSPFKKYRHFFNEVNDPEFHLLQQSDFIVRRFNLSYNYRFGKLQDDITRKKRGIKNDDLKTGEQQTQKN